jgi:hypothetical protein
VLPLSQVFSGQVDRTFGQQHRALSCLSAFGEFFYVERLHTLLLVLARFPLRAIQALVNVGEDPRWRVQN